MNEDVARLNGAQIMEDIEYYDIPVYNFPYDVEEDDEDTIQDNGELRVRILLHGQLPLRLICLFCSP